MMALKQRVKAWLGPIWWYAAMMFAVQRFGDVINLYAGLWLIPKWVPQEELGALLPLTQLGGLLGLPLGIILQPFTKFVNTFGARDEYGKVKALLTDALLLVGFFSILIGAYTWLSAPHLFARMRIERRGIVLLICILSVASILLPILNSALQALKQFRCISAIGLIASPVRLLVLLALLPLSGIMGYFAAQVALYLVSIGIGFWGLRKVIGRGIRRESYAGHIREMAWYTLPVTLLMAVGSVTSTVQVFVIRQRLPDVESAAFYFVSRFAEIPNMLWTAIAVAFFPIVSEAFEKGRDTARMLAQSLAFTVLGGGAVAAALGFCMGHIFRWVPRWNEYGPYGNLVIWMSLTNVLRVAFTCFSTHEIACRRFGFVAYAVPLSLAEAGILVALTGYGFFAPFVPAAWVEWMAGLRAARLGFIVGVMFCSALATFLVAVAQFLLSARSAVRTGVQA